MSVKINNLGPVRFSYLHIVEPRQNEDGTPGKYDATLLIPKDDKETLARINKAIDDAYQEAVTKMWGGKKPKEGYWFNPLQDGDAPNRNGEERSESFAGHYFLAAKSSRKPQLILFRGGEVAENGKVLKPGKLEECINMDDFYSGCYGYASVAFGGFDNNNNKGISCYLNNLLKTSDGEPLGGGKSNAMEDFSAFASADDDDL